MSIIRKLRVVTKIGSANSSAIPALSQGTLATGRALISILCATPVSSGSPWSTKPVEKSTTENTEVTQRRIFNLGHYLATRVVSQAEIQNLFLNLNRSELYWDATTIVSRAFSFQLLKRERRRKTTTPGADFILTPYGQRLC